MAARFDADGDYASLSSLTEGQFSDGGFNNFFIAGWYRRNLAEETYSTIADGSLVHLHSAAREYAFGFDNTFVSGLATDGKLTVIGDGFDVDFVEQPPFDRWVWLGFTDVADVTWAFWSPLGGEDWHFVKVANAHVTSQYVQIIRIGGNTSNVAGGRYAYWRARKGGIRDLSTLRRLKRSWRPEAGDFAFWPMEYDLRDYAGKLRNLTLTGTVTYGNDSTLLSYLRGSAPGPLPFINSAGAANDIIAAGSLSITGAADLDATGALVGAGSLAITGVADLDATGSLAAAGSISITGAAVGELGGVLTAAGTVSITGAADLDAIGQLVALGSVSISGVGDLDAVGSLAAAGSVVITGAADLSGSINDIVAAGSLSITGAAALNATGSLAAAGSLSITGAATITGLLVDIEAVGSVSITGAAVLNAIGQLSAVGSLAIEGLATLTPISAPSVSAGGSAKRRKRYFFELDGEYFEVDSQAEAEQKLVQALTLAQEVIAPRAVERSAKRIRRGKKAAAPHAPTIKSSPEIASVVDEYRSRIDAVYRQIAIDAELRELLRLRLLDEDDEEAIFVLLH